MQMDRFQYSQTRKQQTKYQKRLTQDQVRLLETNFTMNNKLDPDLKFRLALELGIPPRQVAIWFQNKRARAKNQSLEVDHQALQIRFENVLVDNERLKGEVEKLKNELSMIKGTLNSRDISSSYDLEGELYPSLIGDGGQFVTSNKYDFSDS
ncbi:hypothetical protein BUALT_Bualt03G0052100 [Buddleja alternifolia]|uniref:Homeobox-leucine zipper protein n=1 Tax=Buddleja alternifolia TaxID=168488 RepID=A0AAV6XSQ2_9LAMI|nr:hypothetical protein BUALT_Bualt03G0052100 [Buddleja alternifolia]